MWRFVLCNARVVRPLILAVKGRKGVSRAAPPAAGSAPGTANARLPDEATNLVGLILAVALTISSSSPRCSRIASLMEPDYRRPSASIVAPCRGAGAGFNQAVRRTICSDRHRPQARPRRNGLVIQRSASTRRAMQHGACTPLGAGVLPPYRSSSSSIVFSASKRTCLTPGATKFTGVKCLGVLEHRVSL